jgi:hypothetical protein
LTQFDTKTSSQQHTLHHPPALVTCKSPLAQRVTPKERYTLPIPTQILLRANLPSTQFSPNRIQLNHLTKLATTASATTSKPMLTPNMHTPALHKSLLKKLLETRFLGKKNRTHPPPQEQRLNAPPRNYPAAKSEEEWNQNLSLFFFNSLLTSLHVSLQDSLQLRQQNL